VRARLLRISIADRSLDKLVALAEEVNRDVLRAALADEDRLAQALRKGAIATADWLLDLGVDPNARPSSLAKLIAQPGAFTALVTSPKISAPERARLTTRLLAAGARPGETHPDQRSLSRTPPLECLSALDLAVLEGRFELVATMVPAARDDETTLASALVVALRRLAFPLSPWRGLPDLEEEPGADAIERLLSLGLPRAGTSRWGWPIAHTAALYAPLPLFRLVVAEDATLHLQVPDELELTHPFFPPGRVLRIPAGATLLDVVESAAPLFEETAAKDPTHSSGFWAERLAERQRELEAVAQHLRAAGVARAGGAVPIHPSHLAVIDAVATWIPRERVEHLVRTLQSGVRGKLIEGRRAPGVLSAIVDAFRSELEPRLAPHADANVLAFLLCNGAQRFPYPITPAEQRDWHDVDPTSYSVVDPRQFGEPARGILSRGALLGRRGEGILVRAEDDTYFEITTAGVTQHGSFSSLLEDLTRRV
jgi:hypothetical protein